MVSGPAAGAFSPFRMGFQHLSTEALKKLSSKGGKKGAGHRFTSEEARAAGKKSRRGPTKPKRGH